jgi:hypothetical protein
MAFEELKAKQAVMWGTGPYEAITAQIPGMGELLVDKLDPMPGERWVDVASGLHERHRVGGGISQPRLYLLTIGRRK